VRKSRGGMRFRKRPEGADPGSIGQPEKKNIKGIERHEKAILTKQREKRSRVVSRSIRDLWGKTRKNSVRLGKFYPKYLHRIASEISLGGAGMAQNQEAW